MRKVSLTDACEGAGLLSITVGCFLIAPAVGFIVAGFSLVVWGVATGRKR